MAIFGTAIGMFLVVIVFSNWSLMSGGFQLIPTVAIGTAFWIVLTLLIIYTIKIRSVTRRL